MAAAVVHSSHKRFTMLGHCCEGTRILQGAWGGPRGAARCSAARAQTWHLRCGPRKTRRDHERGHGR